MGLVRRQLIAIIDKRTTVICLEAAGQVVGANEPFHTMNGDLYDPPFHVHCRSMVAPWVDGWGEALQKGASKELATRPASQFRRLPPLPRQSLGARMRDDAKRLFRDDRGSIDVSTEARLVDGWLDDAGRAVDDMTPARMQRIADEKWPVSERNFAGEHPVVGRPYESAVYREAGYDAPTEMLDDVDFDALPGDTLWRGVHDSAPGVSPDDMVNAWESGELYVGTGMHVNGSYFAVGRDVAEKYAGDAGRVFAVKLKPGAKVFDYRQQVDELADLSDDMEPIWLVEHGYDAVRVTRKDGDMVIVLNRGATVTKTDSVVDAVDGGIPQVAPWKPLLGFDTNGPSKWMDMPGGIDRAVNVWAESFEGQRAIRQIMRNLDAEVDDVFAGVSFDGKWFDIYRKTIFDPQRVESTEGALRDELLAAAMRLRVEVTDLADNGTLYRGMRVQDGGSLFKVGDEVDMNMVSAAPSERVAKLYTTPFKGIREGDTPVVMEIRGAKSVDIDQGRMLGGQQGSREHLVVDRVTITSVTREGDTLHVVAEQSDGVTRVDDIAWDELQPIPSELQVQRAELGLDEEHYDALADWTISSQAYTEAIRSGKALKPKFARLMQLQEESCVSLKSPMVVDRVVPGAAFKGTVLPQVGDEVSDRAWATGSLDDSFFDRHDPFEWSEDWDGGGVMMTIRCPPGTRGFYPGPGDDWKKGKEVPRDSQEFVLAPGTKMRVVKVVEPDDPDFDLPHVTVEVIPE